MNFELNFTLKKLRLFREVDQKTVAEKIGLTASGYQKKECGNREFTATELNLLAKFFNKTMDEMFIIVKNKKSNTKTVDDYEQITCTDI